MLLRNLSISAHFLPSFRLNSSLLLPRQLLRPISSLKVVWRKDAKLDEAIDNDKKYKLCARVVREVLNEPGQVIPLRYLEKRRERLRLKVRVRTFLDQNPGLFDTYYDRIRPKSDLVPFLRPNDRLRQFLEEERRISAHHEGLIVSKLCKLLMMSKDRVMSVDKLVHVKREFGFPNDFLVNLVPRYPQYFHLVGSPGEGKSFLELVSWNPEFAKSAIETRAEEESRMTGIWTRPNFNVKLPPRIFPQEGDERMGPGLVGARLHLPIRGCIRSGPSISRDGEENGRSFPRIAVPLTVQEGSRANIGEVYRGLQVLKCILQCVHEAFGDILYITEGRNRDCDVEGGV